MRISRISGVLFGATVLGAFAANPDGIPLAGACTPPVRDVAVLPAAGGPASALNTDIVLKGEGVTLSDSTVSVVANALPVSGTFVPLSESFALAPEWLVFQPTAPFAAATTVTVVVSSASGLTASESFDFTVGAATDNTPPSGGAVVGHESFEGTSASGTSAWGWRVDFGAVSDAEGPAFIRVTVSEGDDTSTYLLEGSESTGADASGLVCAQSVEEGTTVDVTAVPIDLAGNVGAADALTFQVEGGGEGGGGCSVTESSRSFPWIASSMFAACCAAFARKRRRS